MAFALLALAAAGCTTPAPPACCQARGPSGADRETAPAALGAASAVPVVDRRESGGGGSPDGPQGAAAFGDRSLFHSETSWVGDDGRRIRLGALSGRPQVVAMFFASCQFTCPVIVHDMRRIEAALDPATRARVGFALVSFDSLRDTPEALAAYREARALPRPGWTLLRGEPDDVQELAALLGVSYQQDARGDFAHSNQIAVLDAEGQVVHRLVGLNQDVAATVALLEKLARP